MCDKIYAAKDNYYMLKCKYDSAKTLDNRIFPNDYLNHIIHADCTDVLKKIPSESIDLIVTSPPYFVEKAYEKTWTFDFYRELLRTVFKECYRLLKPGKYFVINFGDYFNSGNRFYKSDVPSVYPASSIIYEIGSNENFDLQATRIWRKNFAKMTIPFVCNHHPRPVFDYEHIWTFRKKDGVGKEKVRNRKLSQRAVWGEEWTTSARQSKHESAFPLELPSWVIEIYSDAKDIILDPFLGIGTTMIACINLKRNCIGIEKESSYCKIAYKEITKVIHKN